MSPPVERNDMGKRITEEEKREIIELAQQGFAVKEIIVLVGRSQTTVNHILKNNGITAVKKYPKKPPTITNSRKQIIDLREQNKSYREIAKQLGVNRHYVLKVSRLFGLDGIRARTRYIDDPDDYIKRYSSTLEYVSGWTSCDDYAMVRCLKCGHTFNYSMKTLRSHRQENYCPECRRSELMQKIAERNRLLQEKKEQEQKQKYEHFWSQEFEQKSWKICPICGSIFAGYKTYCSDYCRNQNKWKMKDGYRYLFPLEQVYERDNGICWICGGKCDWNDYEERDGIIVYGNNYPSRDHVIPKSKGGVNSWENIRLAHRICNSKKSASDSPLVKIF